MRFPFAVTKVIGSLKNNTRLPLWTRYLVWFLETLFYDWRWARNRMAQLVSERV